MTAPLTEQEFSKHLKTTFHVIFPDGQVDLELDQVKGYLSKHPEHDGMERFSLFFQGPPKPQMPQYSYKLQHDQMGEFEIFLVPVSRDDLGVRYEAVFNYFKSAQ